ncbi:MAG: alanine/glycine:cation symporter family protein [Peptococcaceae bacterium]|nr:alanine/glycine:cation symporter family protein [Peptococcaceae bacterium]
MTLTERLVAIDDFMYLYILVGLLIIIGVFLTIRTNFVQLRYFPESFKVVMEKKTDKEAISSFQALMVATASRVGTGNIAGIATALVAGGPGALMWMWIMAIIGGASAFAESTLAQVYKERDGAIFKGGPAYYIRKAMGKNWLGMVFAVLLIITFAYGFNGLQAYNIVSAFEYYSSDWQHSSVPVYLGIILTVVATLLFFGGVEKISKVSSILVPIMAALYIILGLTVTIVNIGKLPEVVSMIVTDAFDFRAIFGGMLGSCLVMGIKRGLFSNEAGMGSAPNAAASSDVSHPVKQGLVQVLSVFIDTMVICSTTGFLVLFSGVYEKGGAKDGIPLVQAAVETVFGSIGVHVMTAAVVLFAFTSLIGNYFYAEFNARFISDNKAFLFVFRITCCVMVFVGAINSMAGAWALADITMGFMAIVNIIALFCLNGVVKKVLDDYTRQKKAGKDPVFKAKEVGIENTTPGIWE